MSRKKINLELRGLRTPRERMWAAMRLLDEGPREFGKTFTAEDVEWQAHPVSRDQVTGYLACLQAGGLVKCTIRPKCTTRPITKSGGKAFAYQLLKRPAEAPRLDRAGQPVTQGSGVQAMWQMAKVLRRFTYARLAEVASQGNVQVKPATAREYCQSLARSGHFRLGGHAVNRRGSAPVIYEVANNTGPHAPAITREKCVFDRNTGMLVPIRSPQEVCDASR